MAASTDQRMPGTTGATVAKKLNGIAVAAALAPGGLLVLLDRDDRLDTTTAQAGAVGCRGVRCSGRYVRSGALEVCPVKLVERFPVPGVRLGVVGRVVGHRESVACGIELQGVVDPGAGKRVLE